MPAYRNSCELSLVSVLLAEFYFGNRTDTVERLSDCQSVILPEWDSFIVVAGV